MGYHLIDGEPRKQYLLGADAAMILNRFELRADLARRTKLTGNTDLGAWAGLARASLNLFEENRLKLDLQYVHLENKDILSPGLSCLVNSDLTLRLAADIVSSASSAAVQLYWYHKL
jgi:hypothetical protein